MQIRLSDQKEEFIKGWIACRNWGMGEAHPECPYEWGYTQKENDQFETWRRGFSTCLSEYSRERFIDDTREHTSENQLDLFE